MKRKENGFAATGILYTILLIFLVLMSTLLVTLSSRTRILDKLKSDAKSESTEVKNVVYANGTAVYYNPETGKKCEDYTEANSTTGTKSGCMKWYVFNDKKGNATVNVILDHNTTSTVVYNSTGYNNEMEAVADVLKTDTRKWKSDLNPRLIEANEIAKITGHPTFDASKGNQEAFFFDSNNQTHTASSTNKSNYAWLFDYTDNCTVYGCNKADSSTYGYWTSTRKVDNSTYAWLVVWDGSLGNSNVTNGNFGVRPVITIPKSVIKDGTGSEEKIEVYANGTEIYYNPETGKKCTGYTEANSKTGKKSGCMKWYVFNDDDKSSTVNVILDHNTTASVTWNSTANALKSNTSNWKSDLNPRLITANEIAKITGNTGFDASKTGQYWFYFDSNNQTQKANSTNKSKYAWLFDYTYVCMNSGCNTPDSNTYGYWTSTRKIDDSTYAWRVSSSGTLGDDDVPDTSYGVRPVITIPKSVIKDGTGSEEKIEVYANGTEIYYNPETGKKCTGYTEANSKTGKKSGCMKWYVFNDDDKSSTVNVILDHNTTAIVALNSTGNDGGTKEVADALKSNTSNWKSDLNPRLITANEIAKITGNTGFDATQSGQSWFYLDSNNQTRKANASNKSKYAWLFDYTYGCTEYGCSNTSGNTSDSITFGYWTSTRKVDNSTYEWRVHWNGALDNFTMIHAGTGVRPVITIPKSNIS